MIPEGFVVQETTAVVTSWVLIPDVYDALTVADVVFPNTIELAPTVKAIDSRALLTFLVDVAVFVESPTLYAVTVTLSVPTQDPIVE